MLIKSFAKINLSLQITGTREDGYHLLDMVELPIELHDILEIEYSPGMETSHITCDELKLARFKDNLCKTALDVMREKYGFKNNINIFIHKQIPFAAGLGGGSSNTASTLIAINSLFRLGATQQELSDIGLTIGADVPYFFIKKPARVTGIGETINTFPLKQQYWTVLIKPEKGCSSKAIYSIVDKFERKPINNDLVIKGLQTGDEDLIAANIGNDLMEAAMSQNSQIKDALKALKSCGFKIVSMSGSGSTCFALTKSHKLAYEAYKKLSKTIDNVYLSKVLL